MIHEIKLPIGIKGTIIDSNHIYGINITGGSNKKMKRAKTKKKLNKLNKSKKNNLY